MATIYEVSKAAGVSLATVSRVINGNARVSDRTKEKVHKAMDELGYRPNAIAQSLASNRTNSVGLLVSRFIEFVEETGIAKFPVISLTTML